MNWFDSIKQLINFTQTKIEIRALKKKSKSSKTNGSLINFFLLSALVTIYRSETNIKCG